MNLDRCPDAQMLEGACINYARAVEADLMLAKSGLIVEESIIDDKTGEKVVLRVRAHPGVAISRTAWLLVHKFCSEFGLSPVARMRVKIEQKDTGEQDLAALLSAPRAARPAATVPPVPGTVN
jgi:P27 family predicted phage terminase small subunit